MQERHSNRTQYFKEQGITTSKFVIPYIESCKPIKPNSTILEIGCGEGGNLQAFLDFDCQIYGIELLKSQFEQAVLFYKDHPRRNQLNLIHSDIYSVSPSSLPSFDIIFMKDVIEHIPDQFRFLGFLEEFLKEDGVIFFGFPPWRMPFGGHQQVCQSILSKMPYFHILPKPIYQKILQWAHEDPLAIKEFLEVKDTGLSIHRFHQIVKQNQFQILKETYWFINPNYEIKFNIKPTILPRILRIPWLCDFYTTAIYCVISKNKSV